MTAFYLKLFITPALMWAISSASRRWGTQLGGLLSGLPVTSALVMLFLSLEQGSAFVARAVPGALAGLAAIQATYLFYFLVTRRVPALLGCLAGLGFYALTAWAISRLGGVALPVLISLLLVTAIVIVTARQPAPPAASGPVVLPRWVIPMRMLAATGLLLAITASAEWLGPTASGLVAPIPVIAWPLMVFSHVQGGRHELAAVVRGNAIGAVGVVGFYLMLAHGVPVWGALPSIGVAVLLAVAVTFTLARWLNRR